MRNGPAPVVFTDLDGTLLDHYSYSFEAAGEVLLRLRQAEVPLVPCSSKTRTEIEKIQKRLESVHPFVAENGAAAFIPEGYFPFAVPGARERAGYLVLEFGRPHAEVVELLRHTAEAIDVPVVGFSDMTVGEVAETCGLSMLDARLAKLREYDEPFRVTGGDPASRDRLLRALQRAGLQVVRGGRFDHVTGRADKGLAVAALRGLYRRVHRTIVTVGLGDSPNDVSLLRAVDIPVVVLSPVADASAELVRRVPSARVTLQRGPAGWAEAVGQILAELGVGPAGMSPAASL